MTETFADRLTPLLRTGDSAGAWELLQSLDSEERREAKSWIAGSQRWGEILWQLDYTRSERDGDGIRREERDAVGSGQALWMVAMCAIALCGPTTAAQRVPWASFWDHECCPAQATFVHMLWDADPEWVAVFAQAASEVRFNADARRHAGPVLSQTLRAALTYHRLPAPSGATFLECWQGYSWHSVRDAKRGLRLLLNDPLMPGILPMYLASGHSGNDPWLPEAIPELVARGLADRHELLDLTLKLLTAPQRPKSQAVLAGTAKQLNIGAEEVPGGLTYLNGVMATSDKSVVAVLLPLALDLARTGSAIIEVATTVAARPELAPKRLLLKHLQRPDVADAVGPRAIGDVLALLETGLDAKLALQAERLGRRLGIKSTSGPDVGPGGRRPARTGLWDIKPADPGPPRVISEWERRSWRMPEIAGWWGYILRSDSDDSDPRWNDTMLSMVLADMFRGTFDPSSVEGTVRQILTSGHLAVSRMSRILEHLFLAGGMSQTWQLAVATAEACAAAPRRPPALHVLLRLLADYAHEAPPQSLPPHLARLAAAPGETKAQLEVRRLDALISAPAPDSFVNGRHESPATSNGQTAAAPTRRTRSVDAAQPATRWVPDEAPVSTSRVPVPPVMPSLAGLRGELDVDFNYYAQSYDDVSHTPVGHQRSQSATSLTNPDRVLAGTVRAIHEHGTEAVRLALVHIERRSEPIHVVAAIDLWVAGELDFDVFWRLTHDTVTPSDIQSRLVADTRIDPSERHKQLRELPDLISQLRLLRSGEPLAELVLPRPIESVASRLHFLRACEVLLLAEESVHPLSTPTWRDGTLELETLNQRLRELDGRHIGPLDLVQALHRLRRVDPDQAAHVPNVDVRSHPRLTSPDGAHSWDAIDLVRTWVRHGGLPDLDPVVVDGRWVSGQTAPITWSICQAAPQPVRDDEWQHGSVPEMARMLPRWPDRATFATAFAEHPLFDARHFPDQVSGPFGLPLHDALLSCLNQHPRSGGRRAGLSTWNVVSRRRLVDPESLASAAVGRHAAGTLALGRITERIQRILETGGLACTWPAFLAMAGVLCEQDPKPAGLPGFLRLLIEFVDEIPRNHVDRAVPETLRRFALSTGSSRSHAEARALVAALEER